MSIIEIDFIKLRTTTSAAVANDGSTFTTPYPNTVDYNAARFPSSTTATVEYQGNRVTGVAVTFGATEATLTWDAGQAEAIPANVDVVVTVDLKPLVTNPLTDVEQLSGVVANVASLTDSTTGTAAAALVATSDSDTNNNFATLNAKLDETLNALKAILMEAD